MNNNLDEHEELNSILKSAVSEVSAAVRKKTRMARVPDSQEIATANEDKFDTKLIQWSTSNGIIFFPSGRTVKALIPGYYEINTHPSLGIYFEKIQVKVEGLLEFPDANTHRVIVEIQKFWDSRDKFEEHHLTYKRGIILWGPAGGGKSSTLQLVCRDVIKRGGIVVKFAHPNIFSSGVRMLREIQPNTPVVVLMEDIDSTLDNYSETDVLNILDGVDRMDNVVFLATTNYPERLGERIMNRPSRFDKRFKVGYPSPAARKLYIEYLLNGKNIKEVEIERWVNDTKDFSIAHLKELFVAVVVLGDEYETALKTLLSMKTQVTSWGEEDKPKMGLNHRYERDAVESTSW